MSADAYDAAADAAARLLGIRIADDTRPQRLDHGDPLGDRLRRLATWADRTPPHARQQVSVLLDQLAVLLGRLVAENEDDPTQ